MSVPREFKAWVASELGTIPGEISCIVSDRDSAAGQLITKRGVTGGSIYSNIALAEDATVTSRNDTIIVTPESHTWKGDGDTTTATLTWDKDCVHVLGMSPLNRGGYNRSRLSLSATVADTAMLTMSGNANTFKNIRIMHGVAAHDHTCLDISGDGNTFDGCCVASPIVAAQAASADYNGVIITGAMNTFRNCMFGTENDIDRSTASCLLSFSTGCGTWNVFENCIFRSRSGGGQATAYFINDKVTDTIVDYTAIFLNCHFIHNGTALAVGITKAANTSRKLYFDSRCSFAGVTDIIADARIGEIMWGSGGAGPEEVVGTDFKSIGKARILVAT